MNTIRHNAPRKLLSIAVLAAAFSGAAIAAPQSATKLPQISVLGASQATSEWVYEGDGLVANVPFVGLHTRAEVRSEMFASRARGDFVFVGDGLQPRSRFQSTMTTAQVRDAMFASRARGDYVFVGDGLQPRSRSGSTQTASAGNGIAAAE